MKRYAGILWALTAAIGLGFASAAHAKLPPPPPKTEAEKAAEAEKAKAAAAKEAELLDKYRDKAVANYKKNKGLLEPEKPAASAKARGK